jgi:hypothetical protein
MSISRARSAVIGAWLIGEPGCCLRPLSLKEPVSTDEKLIFIRPSSSVAAGYDEDEALTILRPSAGHERPVVHGVESLEVCSYQRV